MLKITLLGVGLMGAPMSRRLLGAGHALTVWNRSPDKAQALTAQGARQANTPAQAVQDADLVITMLTDGHAVGQVLFDPATACAAQGLRPGALVIDAERFLPSPGPGCSSSA